MADLDLSPGVLNISGFRREDTVSFEWTVVEDGVPVVLPTTGWEAQIRAEAGNSDDPPLASITVDSSDADTGVFRFSIASADTRDLPDVAFWDLQHTPTERTWVAGKLKPKDQVTQ
jgi:hypothetical protein